MDFVKVSPPLGAIATVHAWSMGTVALTPVTSVESVNHQGKPVEARKAVGARTLRVARASVKTSLLLVATAIAVVCCMETVVQMPVPFAERANP